jgi:hypothetical protein
MSNFSPIRAFRRYWKPLASLVFGMIVVVGAIPWLLGTAPARHWIVARANRVLAPGSLELGALRLSWFGPTRVEGLVLRDAQGDRVVAAPRASLNRTFGQILTDRARSGIIALEEASLDVERLADGKIDLFETIKPLLNQDPRNDLTIRLDRARLQIRAAGLSEPIVSDRTDFTLKIPPAPRPLSWTLGMAKTNGSTLEIDGNFDLWNAPSGAPPDLLVSLASRTWPIAIETEAMKALGQFEGSLRFQRKTGEWSSDGRATLGGLDATGRLLAGDHLRLDRVVGDWDLSANAGAVKVRRLDVSSPLGVIKADGTHPAPPGEPARFEGTLDLAALARQLPHALRLPEGVSLDEEPLGLTFKVLYHRDADRLDFGRISLAGRYAALEAAGSLTDLSGKKVAELNGRLTPDWTAINRLLAERIEPNARVQGQPWTVRFQGALGGDRQGGWLEAIDAYLGIKLTAAEVYGMRLGPTSIVLRARQGKLAIEPIDATLNAGRVHLEPQLVLDDEKGSAIRLGPSSSITDAEINDEVSHRVLSFVAPVLDRATRVRGRVSVGVEDAVFPLSGESKQKTQVEGSVVFNDVEFVPGPLGHELLGAIGRSDVAGLRLNEPVALTIADRRVYQEGLALPIGKLTQIELEGWVDFDRNLEMTASLPLTSQLIANRPVLRSIVEGTKFQVPIRGTLKKPEIDKEAMNLALQDLGQRLLFQGATQGLPNLLNRLMQPRDPNAPPPLTPAERRARRLERRAERKGLVPPPRGIP